MVALTQEGRSPEPDPQSIKRAHNPDGVKPASGVDEDYGNAWAWISIHLGKEGRLPEGILDLLRASAQEAWGKDARGQDVLVPEYSHYFGGSDPEYLPDSDVIDALNELARVVNAQSREGTLTVEFLRQRTREAMALIRYGHVREELSYEHLP